MRRARLTTYMSLGELAALLGMPPGRTSTQKLRRRLKAKQRRTKTIFLQHVTDAPNAPLCVTLASLRQHCPELFDRREEALETIREVVGGIQESVLELKRRDSAIAARVREHGQRLDRLESVRHDASRCVTKTA